LFSKQLPVDDIVNLIDNDAIGRDDL